MSVPSFGAVTIDFQVAIYAHRVMSKAVMTSRPAAIRTNSITICVASKKNGAGSYPAPRSDDSRNLYTIILFFPREHRLKEVLF